MNWFKKQIVEWALRQQERKKVELKYRGEPLEPIRTSEGPYRSDVLEGCTQLRFTIVQVDNGTLVRMDTQRLEDQYTVRSGPPRTPPTFIVKDDETVQDVVVRLLGIAALERS
jgi:hypothetical protein